MRLLSRILTAAAACVPAAHALAQGLQKGDLLVGDSAVVAPDAVDEKTFISAGERYLIGIVAMVAVGVFVWIGYNLLTAEGQTEQFKKAQKALTYAIVGLVLIPLAYAIVKVVISVNF